MRRGLVMAAMLGVAATVPSAAPSVATATDEPAFVFVAFEDRPGRDHDFNDVGLLMSAGEVYGAQGALLRVALEFELACRQSGDEHEVHVTREFEPRTRWLATLRRSRDAEGAETPANAWEGRGAFDVVLYDTARAALRDEVHVTLELLESAEPLATEPLSVQGIYDTWLLDRTTGVEVRGDARQRFGDEGGEVPCILVLPDPGWQPPGEWSSISDLYPEFVRWHVAGDPAAARWWEVAPR